MALAVADRVRETTTTTGTGTVTLAGAVTGYQSFSAIGNGNTTYYTINAGSQWEVGIGTYTASGTTLSRDTVLASSNAGALVNFSAGTKDVFATYPAGKAVYQDASGNVGIGTAAPGSKLDVAGEIRIYPSSSPAQLRFGVSGVEKGKLAVDSSSNMLFETAGSERMRITSTGFVGIGVTPSASTEPLLQMQNGGMIATAGPYAHYMANAFYGAGGWTYTTTGTASRYEQAIGTHKWYVAASGTAGNPITFTQAMALDGAGNLSLSKLAFNIDSPFYTGGNITAGSNALGIGTTGAAQVGFFTNNSERVRISTAGFVGIGTSSPSSKLTVLDGDIEVNATGLGNTLLSFNGTTANLTVNSSSAPLVFGTNSTERMRITSAGLVGIGIASPDAALDVFNTTLGVVRVGGGSGTNQGAAFYVKNAANSNTQAAFGDRARIFGGTPDQLVSIFTSALPLTFDVNGSERARFDTSGNVGIGTTGPDSRLVVSDSAAIATLRVNTSNTGVSASNYSQIALSDADATRTWWRNVRDGSGKTAFGYNNHLAFLSDAGGTPTERMRIDASGNVGIGTSSPTSLGANIAALSLNSTAANTSGGVVFQSGGSQSGRVAVLSGWLSLQDLGSANGLAIDEQSNLPITFKTNATERMRIDSSGNVLVGTTTAGSAGFTVNQGSNISFNEASGQSLATIFRQASSGDIVLGSGVARSSTANGFASSYSSAWARSAVNVGYGAIKFYTAAEATVAVGTDTTLNERMRIGSDGTVMIGTTSPEQRLDVSVSSGTEGSGLAVSNSLAGGYGSGINFYSFRSDGTTKIAAGAIRMFGQANWADATNTSSSMRFYTVGNNTLGERMRIDASGLVGINTSSPGERLEVNGSIYINAESSGLIVDAAGNKRVGFMKLPGAEGVIARVAGQDFGITRSADSSLTNASFTYDMYLDGSGNVGIGATSFAGKFNVSMGSATGAGNTSTWDNTYALFGGVTASAAAVGIGFNTSAGGVLSSLAPNTSWRTMNYHAANHVFFFSSAEAMRINTDGNVGIGTSSPGSRLGVVGGSLATSGSGMIVAGDLTTGRLLSGGAAGVQSIHTYFDSHAYEISAGSTSGYVTGIGVAARSYTGTGGDAITFWTRSAERFRITSTGGITSSDLADAVGYKGLPQNSQTTGYTLALSDMGKHISITTGNITIPANGSVAFPVGAAVTIFNNSGSTQTISITTDTLRQAGTTNTGTRTLAAYGVATVLKVASTTWVVSGNVT